MVTASPTLNMVLSTPDLRRAPGGPPSNEYGVTVPFSSFTSAYIYVCGLTHSIFVIVALTENDFELSNSAVTEWCASTGTAESKARAVTTKAPRGLRVMVISVSFLLLAAARFLCLERLVLLYFLIVRAIVFEQVFVCLGIQPPLLGRAIPVCFSVRS